MLLYTSVKHILLQKHLCPGSYHSPPNEYSEPELRLENSSGYIQYQLLLKSGARFYSVFEIHTSDQFYSQFIPCISLAETAV